MALAPPEVVVPTKGSPEYDILQEKPAICDSFWACLLNDYLDAEELILDDATAYTAYTESTVHKEIEDIREIDARKTDEVDPPKKEEVVAAKSKKERKKKKKKKRKKERQLSQLPLPSLTESNVAVDDARNIEEQGRDQNKVDDKIDKPNEGKTKEERETVQIIRLDEETFSDQQIPYRAPIRPEPPGPEMDISEIEKPSNKEDTEAIHVGPAHVSRHQSRERASKNDETDVGGTVSRSRSRSKGRTKAQNGGHVDSQVRLSRSRSRSRGPPADPIGDNIDLQAGPSRSRPILPTGDDADFQVGLSRSRSRSRGRGHTGVRSGIESDLHNNIGLSRPRSRSRGRTGALNGEESGVHSGLPRSELYSRGPAGVDSTFVHRDARTPERLRKGHTDVFHYAPIMTEGAVRPTRSRSRSSRVADPSPYLPDPLEQEPEEEPFPEVSVHQGQSIPREVKVTQKPKVTRRPLKDVEEKSKSKRRAAIDPEEDRSVRSGRSHRSLRSLVSTKTSRSAMSQSRSRTRPKPEDRLVREDELPHTGDGSRDHPIEISKGESVSKLRRHKTKHEVPGDAPGGGRRSRDVRKSEKDMRRRTSDDENLRWRVEDGNVLIKDSSRRRKVVRKEALDRIRAIKARLASVDP